jgi:hypothetical protein
VESEDIENSGHLSYTGPRLLEGRGATEKLNKYVSVISVGALCYKPEGRGFDSR